MERKGLLMEDICSVSDKTKLRSHPEMNVKKFAKDTLTNAAQQLADNIVNAAVNNIIN